MIKYLLTFLFCLVGNLSIAAVSADIGFWKQTIVSSSSFPTTGLVCYYKLEESTTTNRVDQTTNALNLTANNSPTNTTGIILKACNFISASNQYLSHVNALNWSNAGVFSVSFWFKCPNANQASMMVSKGTSSSKTFYIGIGSDGVNVNPGKKVIATLYNSATTDERARSTVTSYADNAIHHCVVTADGTTLLIYIDGSSVSLSNDNTTAGWPNVDNSGSFLVGNYGTLGFPYNGWIDELGYWSVALSAANVTTLYNGGVGLTYP